MNKHRPVFIHLITLIAAVFVCAGILSGCGNTADRSSAGTSNVRTAAASKAEYHKISAEKAKTMMDKNKHYIILDVRTEAEYKAQRLSGAILIPYDEIKNRAAAELPDKNDIIFTYCRTGVRSSSAAHTLADMGYTNVYDIGGIVSWPYDTVSG